MTRLRSNSSVQISRFAHAEVRVDGRDKVSGRMHYAADFRAAGALWAAFSESPYAHARIRSIDVRGAYAVPGVRAVLTADDIGHARFGRVLCDWPILASETVRFIGDRVAAVAAETREAAEEAARAIVVDYEELPAVFDVHAALASDAPVLHPGWDGYDDIAEHALERRRAHPNVYAEKRIGNGSADIEPIFAAAPHVFEHEYTTPRQLAGFIEPRATTVWIDDAGAAHLLSPNKGPYAFRKHFAHAVGLPQERVIIEPVAIGGDFGGKGLTVDELPCYYLARATKRPVRYVATYAEELRRGPTRHATHLRFRTAVDAAGMLIAHTSVVTYDGGAYAATKPIPTLLPGNAYGAVPYRVPNVRLDIRGVYTNTLPAAHVRGPSDVQTFFAWERHVDTIARELGIDPLEFRLRNLVRDGEQSLTGEVIAHPMGHTVLRALQDNCKPLPRGAGYGRGISIVCAHTGSGKTALRMRLTSSGTIEVVIGAVDQGVGLHTVVQRVVSAALDIEPARVSTRRANSRDALPDQGSGHSRVTHIVGRAALDAADQIRTALDALRTGRESFDDLARRACAGGPLDVVGRFISEHGEQVPGDLTFGAYAIDVQVDRETGAIAVRDTVFVMDVGQIINPVAHQGQVEGGFIMGLGAALMEDVSLDADGKIARPSLGEYKLPTMRDIPRLKTVLVQAPPGDGPFGTRMVGELSNVGVPPAIVNAIDDAVGVRLAHFPATAEDVFGALQDCKIARR